MLHQAHVPSRAGAGFPVRVVLPVILAVLGITGTLTLGIYWSARSSDAIALNRQIRMVGQALDASVDQLAQNQESAAVWDASFDEMRRGAHNVAWIDTNIGVWLHEAYGHDRVYLVDPQGNALYAMTGGRHVPPADAWRKAGPAVRRVLAELYHRLPSTGHPHDRVSKNNRTTLLPSGIRMPPYTVHVSHLALVDGRPAAVSAMKIVPNSPERRRIEQSSAGTVVSVRFLGYNFFNELSRRNLLASARFTRDPADQQSSERAMGIHGEDGTPIGWILWRPELPGAFVLKKAAPVAAASLLMTILLMCLLIRSLGRSTARLEHTLVTLRASEAHAQHLAFHDPLTGLANRAMLNARIDQVLNHRGPQFGAALILIDLDRFKRINDTLGHAAGDTLLSQFATRIAALCTRGEIVARLGGDEFAIFIPHAADHVSLRHLCQNVLTAARAPFDVTHSMIHIGASLGVAFADQPDIDRIELMRRADIALFRTKAHGKNGFRFFEGAMDDAVLSRTAIEEELHAALARGDGLTVHYQPLVTARTGIISGLEALVRWQHPVQGLIGPDQFVPIAEESGLIVPLGEWVLREVCLASLRWPKLGFAVNLSPAQFVDSGFAARVFSIIAETGADPRRITLEITEGVLLADDAIAMATLDKLRDAGFSIALDDFGTGYSSLGYLRRFAVDRIKIDRSFVQLIGGEPDSSAIVLAIIALGHAMNLRVTAEGVETEAQHRFLAAAGCDTLQGFLFSRPVPEELLPPLFDQIRMARVA